MGRKRKYTRDEFRKAYKQCSSVKELAQHLSLSTPTVYNYLSRFNLKPYETHKESELSRRIASMYRFDVTTVELAQKFEVSRETIYWHLRKFVLYPKRYRLTEKYPPPKKVDHIKVIHALLADPKAFRNPRRLLEIPGITREIVDSYLSD